jgi:hypothetical protein
MGRHHHFGFRSDRLAASRSRLWRRTENPQQEDYQQADDAHRLHRT